MFRDLQIRVLFINTNFARRANVPFHVQCLCNSRSTQLTFAVPRRRDMISYATRRGVCWAHDGIVYNKKSCSRKERGRGGLFLIDSISWWGAATPAISFFKGVQQKTQDKVHASPAAAAAARLAARQLELEVPYVTARLRGRSYEIPVKSCSIILCFVGLQEGGGPYASLPVCSFPLGRLGACFFRRRGNSLSRCFD